MIDSASHDGEKNIALKEVKEFPLLFRTSTNTNLVREARFWDVRNEYLNDDGHVSHIGSTSLYVETLYFS